MSDEAIYVAASGAVVQEMRLEVLSNNLANINTVGFKEDRAVFSSYFPGDQNRITETEPDSTISEDPETLFPYLLSNTQVKFEGTQTSFLQGPLRHTGNTLDFALDGKGFFCFKTTQDIVQYSRKGNFTLNQDGTLVTQDGFPVLNTKGDEIVITGRNISVDNKGEISVDGTQVDTLKVVGFDQPNSLVKVGDTSFILYDTAVSENESEGFKVKQGFVELSNVDPIRVMTEMIEVHRAFESYQKIMKSMDETVSKSINEVGSPV